MDKIQIIIDYPNKVYGYPESYKGRKTTGGMIYHCSKTKEIWNNHCFFVGGFTEFVHVKCKCQC